MFALPVVTQGAMAAIDACLALEDLKNNKGTEAERNLRIASFANRLVCLGFSAAGIGMNIGGVDSKTLSIVKGCELLPRVTQFPISLAQQFLRFERSKGSTLVKTTRLIEKGVIGPLADILRTSAEFGAYYEGQFLEMPKEELDGLQRPVYQYVDGELEIIGYKPIDLEECLKIKEICDQLSIGSSAVRLVAEGEVCSWLTKHLKTLYGQIAIFFQTDGHNHPRFAKMAHQYDGQVSHNREKMEKLFSLKNLSFIPLFLHDDGLFKKFVCPITNYPIIDPVRDPTANGEKRVYYEKAAIYRWLEKSEVSPVTKQPLTIAELKEAPLIKALIHQRMEYHDVKLHQYLQENPELIKQLIEE